MLNSCASFSTLLMTSAKSFKEEAYNHNTLQQQGDLDSSCFSSLVSRCVRIEWEEEYHQHEFEQQICEKANELLQRQSHWNLKTSMIATIRKNIKKSEKKKTFLILESQKLVIVLIGTSEITFFLIKFSSGHPRHKTSFLAAFENVLWKE